MPSFSRTSKYNLSQCHKQLQVVAYGAIRTVDFKVICGHRSEAEQNRLYPKYSKVQWPNSKHNQKPSMAFDFVKVVNELTTKIKKLGPSPLKHQKKTGISTEKKRELLHEMMYSISNA